MYLAESIRRLDELLGGETEARHDAEKKIAKRDARVIKRPKKPKRLPERGIEGTHATRSRSWVTP